MSIEKPQATSELEYQQQFPSSLLSQIKPAGYNLKQIEDAKREKEDAYENNILESGENCANIPSQTFDKQADPPNKSK